VGIEFQPPFGFRIGHSEEHPEELRGRDQT
jgi:hypothetical protein